MGKAFKNLQTRYYLVKVDTREGESEWRDVFTSIRSEGMEDLAIKDVVSDIVGYWDDDEEEALNNLVDEFKREGCFYYGDFEERACEAIFIHEITKREYSVFNKYAI